MIWPLLLWGCGGPSGAAPVELDPALLPLEQAAIAEAVEQWAEATDTLSPGVEVASSPCGGAVGFAVAESSRGYAMTTADRSCVLVFAEAVRADPDPPLRMLSAALHELGHVLGAGHTDAGLMGDAKYHDCIDAIALEAVCSAFPCGPLAAPTCDPL